MENIDILFELGFEEMPSGYILPAIKALKKSIITLFNEYKLNYDTIKMFSTPRRLAFIIRKLQNKQNDETIKRVGPSLSVSYDKNHSLTKAALGFLRSADAKEEDIFVVNTPKGDKIAVKKEIKGKFAKEILNERLPEIIYKLTFPKSMKWGVNTKSFARPIRWILSLINDEVWDFEIENLTSDGFTFGNRFLGIDKKVQILSIDDYERILEKNYVIPDYEKRKKMIIAGINEVATNVGLKYMKNEALIDEVNNLIEYPTPVLSSFDKKYLKLPDKIIVSTLSKNQKYFALTDENENLSEKFIFISNGNPNYNDLIRVGNEKVVKARLEDAEFYFNEDTKHSLEYYVPKLRDVLFHKDIGNLFEKTQRIVSISKYIAENLNLPSRLQEFAARAAYLCKADLVTKMLGEKEFTKLQGYIGSKYALISGEKEEVATAISEHYLPKGKSDDLPATITGAIVAIADKIDTISSIFSVNQIPTGSNDPFALRRAAIGVVKIVDKFELKLDIFQLINKAFSLLNKSDNKMSVYDFFKSRIIWYLGTINIDYDVINSVTHIDFSNIPDVKKRAKALQNYKQNSDFKKLVITFKRVSNIIQEFKDDVEVDSKKFTEKQENELYLEILKLEKEIKPLLEKKEYEKIMEKLVELSPIIDNFFDKVLVNTENEIIRKNRYALLLKIRKIFLTFADLNKLD